MDTQDSTLMGSDYHSAFNSNSQRPRKNQGQDRDHNELTSMGKKQVLQRNFGFLSILGFSSILIGTWENILNVLTYGLQNGGPAGLVYGFLFIWVGMFAVAACLAEMASMAPTSGGQYYWVAMLSPRSCGKVLSYVNGFLSVSVWQATFATGGLTGGTLIKSLVVLNHPEADLKPWHTTLFFYGFVLLALFVNTYLIKWLPALEGMILILHILGFFAILIPLVYLSHAEFAPAVFTTFINYGEWSSQGLSFFVGLPGSVYAFLGIDTAAHLAEEVQNASTTVPWSLVATVGLNGALGFAILVALLSSIGDIETALDGSSGYPFVNVFAQVAGVPGCTVMACVLLVLFASANVSFLATAARILWAFARDNGLPGSRRLAQINKHTALPLYSIGTTTIISLLLALINIGSQITIYALLNGVLAGYLATLLLPCSLLLHRRLVGDIGEPIFHDYDAIPVDTDRATRLRWGPWRMPTALGVAVNLFACVFLTIVLLFAFWPTYAEVTRPQDANYASVVFVSTIMIALVYYFSRSRKFYLKPVAGNQRWLSRRGNWWRWNCRP